MSLIFRAVLAGKGVQRCVSGSNLVKFNFTLPAPNANSCKCKLLSTTSTSLRRDYSTKSTGTNEEAASDKNVDGREVVYEGLLTKSIRRLKILSLTTSIVGVSLQPLLYSKVVTAGTVTAITLPLFGCIAALAIATPPLLHIITKRYIICVEYDHKNDKYIAMVYNLFGMRRQIEFTADDVTMPTVQGMFSNCLIKGKPVFLDAKSFTDQIHYIKIMGYDKPLDLQVENSEDCSNKKND